jgi:DNA-binding response OmpR family regulator
MASGGLDLRRAHVLLLEDNARGRDVLATILRGFRVRNFHQCESVEDAKRFLRTSPVDLILADCEMPEEDGIAFTRWVRSDPDAPNFTVPLVLFSAFTSEAQLMAVRDAGANMIVAKPIIPSALLARIEWVARNHRAFVVSDGYRGPDRRFKSGCAPVGIEERRADILALTADHDRTMSQNDVDSLFG